LENLGGSYWQSRKAIVRAVFTGKRGKVDANPPRLLDESERGEANGNEDFEV